MKTYDLRPFTPDYDHGIEDPLEEADTWMNYAYYRGPFADKEDIIINGLDVVAALVQRIRELES